MNANTAAGLSLHLSLAEIVIPSGRRSVDPETVKRLARSIDNGALHYPITVRSVGGKHELVAGLHRIEAFRLLNKSHIPATVVSMSRIEARMWEISENLHRAELTVLERSEQIAEWIELAKEKRVSRQVDAKPQGGRPESGVRAASRDLGVEEPEARRAVKIASISSEAAEAAKEAGIDDNQSKLLKVAAVSATEQVAVVHQLAGARSIMASRIEPADSLDFFATPPWATRALMERVLPHLSIMGIGIAPGSMGKMWEPACGEGHISGVLEE